MGRIRTCLTQLSIAQTFDGFIRSDLISRAIDDCIREIDGDENSIIFELSVISDNVRDGEFDDEFIYCFCEKVANVLSGFSSVERRSI